MGADLPSSSISQRWREVSYRSLSRFELAVKIKSYVIHPLRENRVALMLVFASLKVIDVSSGSFLYDSCIAARKSQLVGGKCSMLPYGTGICCYAFI